MCLCFKRNLKVINIFLWRCFSLMDGSIKTGLWMDVIVKKTCYMINESSFNSPLDDRSYNMIFVLFVNWFASLTFSACSTVSFDGLQMLALVIWLIKLSRNDTSHYFFGRKSLMVLLNVIWVIQVLRYIF